MRLISGLGKCRECPRVRSGARSLGPVTARREGVRNGDLVTLARTCSLHSHCQEGGVSPQGSLVLWSRGRELRPMVGWVGKNYTHRAEGQ